MFDLYNLKYPITITECRKHKFNQTRFKKKGPEENLILVEGIHVLEHHLHIAGI